MKLLIGLFETFDPAELVEAGFHQFLYESIKSEEVSVIGSLEQSNLTLVFWL